MRFLPLIQLAMMTPGYILVISPAKLKSQNLMFRLTTKRSRLKNPKRIRRRAIAKSLRKSNNKMKSININLKRKKMPKFIRHNNFELTRKTITISKTLKILRHLKNSRGHQPTRAVKFKVLPNKLFLMKPKDNLTKPFKTRSTKSLKKLIIH